MNKGYDPDIIDISISFQIRAYYYFSVYMLTISWLKIKRRIVRHYRDHAEKTGENMEVFYLIFYIT